MEISHLALSFRGKKKTSQFVSWWLQFQSWRLIETLLKEITRKIFKKVPRRDTRYALYGQQVPVNRGTSLLRLLYFGPNQERMKSFSYGKKSSLLIRPDFSGRLVAGVRGDCNQTFFANPSIAVWFRWYLAKGFRWGKHIKSSNFNRQPIEKRKIFTVRPLKRKRQASTKLIKFQL